MVYSVSYTVYRIQRIIYSVSYTAYHIQCMVYSVSYTVYRIQRIIYSVSYTVYGIQCIVYSVLRIQCIVYSVSYTVYRIQCIVYSASYAARHTQCIICSVIFLVLASRLSKQKRSYKCMLFANLLKHLRSCQFTGELVRSHATRPLPLFKTSVRRQPLKQTNILQSLTMKATILCDRVGS